MHFDVPKFVRSPGCDHGYDEGSRNGRDIKIDILDDFVRAPESFQTYTGVPGVTGTPPRGGENGATWALVEIGGSKGEEAIGQGEARQAGVLLPLGVGLLLFLVGVGEGEGKGEEEKERGAPLALNQFGLGLGRARPTLPLLPSISTKAHVGPLRPRGVPVTPGTPVYV